MNNTQHCPLPPRHQYTHMPTQLHIYVHLHTHNIQNPALKKKKNGGGVVTNNPKLVDYKINVKFLASSNFKN